MSTLHKRLLECSATVCDCETRPLALDIYQNAFPCNCRHRRLHEFRFHGISKNGTTKTLSAPTGIPDGFPNPSRIYKSMELIVSKRYQNFQFYGSYVLSKLRWKNFQDLTGAITSSRIRNISSMFDFTNSDG